MNHTYILIMSLAGMFFFSLILIRATNLVMDGLRRVAGATHLGSFGIASFVLAFSTTLPETFVGVAAAIHGNGALVLGNSLGSNIANLSLIIGLAALVSGSVITSGRFVKRDVFYVFLTGSVPLLLLMDSSLTRWEGLLLVFIYFAYQAMVLGQKRKKLMEQEPLFPWQRYWIRLTDTKFERGFMRFGVGIVIMLIAAELLVKSATAITVIMNLPSFILGLFVIAVGTSLPELAFEIKAIRKHESQLALGGILGSVVSNSTWVIGLSALISPIILPNGMQPYYLATGMFVLIFFLFWISVRTKHRLDRWEGLILVLIYLSFMVSEWLLQRN